MRIGHGYDVHRLTEGRKLILGGVNIPWEKGLLGHSDADVLVHALMDAMLGAAALGDIGKLFPDNDDAYLGADSIVLLRKVTEVLRTRGWRLSNADARNWPLILKACVKQSRRQQGWSLTGFPSKQRRRRSSASPEAEKA